MPLPSGGVRVPSLAYFWAPSRVDLGELAAGVRRTKLPLASTSIFEMPPLAGDLSAFGYCGVQAQIRYWWFWKEPPKEPMKKLSASVYCFANCHIAMLLPS